MISNAIKVGEAKDLKGHYIETVHQTMFGAIVFVKKYRINKFQLTGMDKVSVTDMDGKRSYLHPETKCVLV